MILALAALALLAAQDPVTTCLRVLRDPSRQPVAGAEVRCCALPERVGTWPFDSDFPRLEPALARTAPAGKTDEHGEIVLPIGDKWLLVEARADDSWGTLCLLAQGEGAGAPGFVHELYIHPDFDLAVRVLDAHDRPLAGIPVAHRKDSLFSNERCRTDWLVRETDERGLVQLRHVGSGMSELGGDYDNRELVAIACCLQPPVEALVDPAHPPREPIVLRMPPTGEIEVCFEEADGAPIPIRGGCAVVAVRKSEKPRGYPPFPRFGMGAADMEYAPAPGTSAFVCRNVGLDGDWDVWVQRNPLSKAVRARVRGPHAAGERVRARVQPPEAALLQGQFVDEAGAARGIVEFCVQVRRMPPPSGWPEPRKPDGSGIVVFSGPPHQPYAPIEGDLGSFIGPRGPSISTDEHGRFRIDFDSAQNDLGELFLTFVERRGEPDERSACVHWEKPPGPGLLDLGRLALAPPPRIASGIVRDAAGRPLAGVLVEGSSDWDYCFRFSTHTLADGAFCLRGRCFEEYTDLRFTLAGFAADPKPGVIRMGVAGMAVVMRKVDPEAK